MWPLNLRIRLVLVLLFSVLPAAILIGINAYSEIRQITQDSRQELSRLLGTAEADLRYAVDDVKRLLEVFGHLSMEHTADNAECSNIFADLLAANPKLTNILIITPQGKVSCSALPGPPALSLADRDYVQEALKQRRFVVGNFIIGRITHKPVLPLALPLIGADQEIQGIIIAALDANWLNKRVLQQRFSDPIDAMLLDKNYKVIASSSRPELIGSSVQDRLLFPLLEEGSTGIVEESPNLDGEASLQGLKRMQFSPGHAAYLVMSRTISSLEGRVINELLVNLLALALIIGAAGLLAWPMAYKFFIANLNRLILQAQQLSLGAMDTRADPALLKSELKPVAQALNAMADALQRKEQQEAEAYAEVRKRETQLKSFLDNSTALAFMVDLEGRLLLANQAFRQVLLNDATELPPQPYYQLLPESVSARARELDEKVIESGSAIRSDEQLSNGPHAPTYLSSRFPLLDKQGSPYALGVIATDISERERLERELQVTCKKLERSNQDLQDFAFISSHDLQEPLRKIEAFSGRLITHCEGELDEKASDYLQRIQSAAHRMRGLINSLLAYSRLTTKPQPFETICLQELVDDVLADLESRIEQSQAQVEVGPLPSLQADPIQIRQLFQNLIANALKFHLPESPPKISISSRPNNHPPGDHGRQMIDLIVSDNGTGFDEKYLAKIFAPFQRLHGRSEYEGTGMGLAIVKKVVDRHGGQITAKSRPNEGATFIVTLPIVPVQRSAA